jgi:hypothetical protein
MIRIISFLVLSLSVAAEATTKGYEKGHVHADDGDERYIGLICR